MTMMRLIAMAVACAAGTASVLHVQIHITAALEWRTRVLNTAPHHLANSASSLVVLVRADRPVR